MGRVYAVTFTATAVTAAVDLFELSPADDRPIRLLGLFLGQTTELGDAAEEQLELRIIRGHTTSGSGGSSATPAPLSPADAAAGFAAEVLNTTLASAGTGAVLWADSWNVRAGYPLIFTPEMQPQASQANTTIVVRLASTPADSITIVGTLIVEEA